MRQNRVDQGRAGPRRSGSHGRVGRLSEDSARADGPTSEQAGLGGRRASVNRAGRQAGRGLLGFLVRVLAARASSKVGPSHHAMAALHRAGPVALSQALSHSS